MSTRCPRCAHERIYRAGYMRRKARAPRPRFRCAACLYVWQPLGEDAHSRLTLRQEQELRQCAADGISFRAAAVRAGVTRQTARRWMLRFGKPACASNGRIPSHVLAALRRAWLVGESATRSALEHGVTPKSALSRWRKWREADKAAALELIRRRA